MTLKEPALLIRPGLLARYDQMQILDGFAQGSGAKDGPPSLWLLLAQSAQGLPRVDNAVLPVFSGANWAHVTETWINNAHRAGQRAA